MTELSSLARIQPRDSQAILQSLAGGVVPRRGLQYVVVGRQAEVEQVLRDLRVVADGGAALRLVIGAFGSGKTFLLSLLRHVALEQRFVVAEADLTAERRLYSAEGHARALYGELTKSMATATRPDGNALPTILERWLGQVQRRAAEAGGFQEASLDDPAFAAAVQAEVGTSLAGLTELAGGFAFAEVVNAYYRGYASGDDTRIAAAVRWLRGEFGTRIEAMRALGVREIVGDENWYDYVKLLAHLVVLAGYRGLIVNLDEAINLYKISHRQNRERNYEHLLTLYNDANQGRAEHLYVLIGGTPEFLENDRRGLYSYEALRSRLQFTAGDGAMRDLSQPVLRLPRLAPEELLILLLRLRDIHALHYDWQPPIADAEVEQYLRAAYARPGAAEHLTPRDVVRPFLGRLNVLQQNPGLDTRTVFAELAGAVEREVRDRLAADALPSGATDAADAAAPAPDGPDRAPTEPAPPEPDVLRRFQRGRL